MPHIPQAYFTDVTYAIDTMTDEACADVCYLVTDEDGAPGDLLTHAGICIRMLTYADVC